jgi:hypothetical protein
MIIDSITNDDIKTKNYFLLALMKLLSIEEKNKIRIYLSKLEKPDMKKIKMAIKEIHKKKLAEGKYISIEDNQIVLDIKNLTKEE